MIRQNPRLLLLPMNKKKNLIFFLIFILLFNCSFDKKSGIWSGYEEEIKRVAELESESKIISSKIITGEDEFSKVVLTSRSITLDSPQNNKNFLR